MENSVLVSVLCITYNHAAYIRSALDGFVSQKTSFNFEILVHDDASTDGTQDILHEYEQKYPHLFHIVYQKQNQYSKGIKVTREFLYPLAKGKYIALCEGDDYWCDANKLQRQVDFLEAHPEYSMSTHNYYVYDCKTGKKIIYRSLSEDVDISPNDVIDWGAKVFQTASILMRKELFIVDDIFPPCNFGDYVRALWNVSHGKIRFFSDIMSVYRINVPNSWTDKMLKAESKKKNIDVLYKKNDILKVFDEYTNYEFHDCIINQCRINKRRALEYEGKYNEILENYSDTLKVCSWKRRLFIYLKVYIPPIADLIEKIIVK